MTAEERRSNWKGDRLPNWGEILNDDMEALIGLPRKADIAATESKGLNDK